MSLLLPDGRRDRHTVTQSPNRLGAPLEFGFVPMPNNTVAEFSKLQLAWGAELFHRGAAFSLVYDPTQSTLEIPPISDWRDENGHDLEKLTPFGHLCYRGSDALFGPCPGAGHICTLLSPSTEDRDSNPRILATYLADTVSG